MTDAATGGVRDRMQNISARRTRVALAIMALLGVSGAEANQILLTSCTDAGAADTGNLRNSIAMANDGDTINGGFLNCPNSKITLTQGQIPIAVNNLTIQGPLLTPPLMLTIDGLNNGRNGMFRHTGTGALRLSLLTLDHSYIDNNTQTAKGGAIYSAGSVYLNSVNIYRSFASTVSGKAYGGAIYAQKQLLTSYAKIMQNQTSASNAAGSSVGGAIFAKGGGSITYTTVSGNSANAVSDNAGSAGGIFMGNATLIQRTTISGNTAHAHAGGLAMLAGLNMVGLTISNSTISGNVATKGPIGGVWAYSGGTVSLTNATIAQNTAGMPNFNGGPLYAPGLAVSYAYLSMTNALIANNGYGTNLTQRDLTLGHGGMLRTLTTNLVRTTAVNLPAGNQTGVCPVLGPLRDNGGLTKTHALLSHSPAIDTGSVVALNEDQRGKQFDMVPLPFPRLSGTAVDIGAYEVQQNDIVFNTSFEGCP